MVQRLVRSLLALLIVTGILAVPSAWSKPSGPARAAAQVTIVNNDAVGNQVSRFDVNGNALDAHDGSIIQVDEPSGVRTFYLYGTSYSCGYQYQDGQGRFCGFKAYSSPDLVHWTDRGYVVPPQQCQACFRPHVVYNKNTEKYVLWADQGGAYGVYTSSTPTGLFQSTGAAPFLNVPGGVDMTLYVDDDPAATAYVVHNTVHQVGSDTAHLAVERLTPNYLAARQTTTAETNHVRLALGNVEAFAVYKRAGRYRILMSDPTCAYCAGETGEVTTTNLLAPQASWDGLWYDPNGWNIYEDRPQPRLRSRIVSNDSCGGQPLAVLPIVHSDNTTGYYFLSDRWNHRSPNESLANHYLGPLTFDSGGALNPIECVGSFELPLPGAPGSVPVPPDQDAHSGTAGFRHLCDQANLSRQQSFSPTRSGVLTSASVTTFRNGDVNAPLRIDVVRASDKAVLSTNTFGAEAVPWAPTALTFQPNVAVTAGQTYFLRLRSLNKHGCYGVEYNDSNPYGGGSAFYTQGGNTYLAEPGRDLKFTTSVSGAGSVLSTDELPAGYTRCAGEGERCTFTGGRVVAYGAGAYLQKIAYDGADCKIGSMGRDPMVAVLKSCYLAPAGGPPGYTACATEPNTCSVTGPAMVAYGANGSFRYRIQNGQVACTAAAWGGDPIFGVVKSCYVANAAAPPGWVQCAGDGGTCAISANQDVAYGARGAYVVRRTHLPIACTADSFGIDPIASTGKSCYRKAPGAPVGYGTKCADEGATCTFSGQRTVAYGEAGNFAYRTFVGSVACTPSSFGIDPLWGIRKSCHLTP
ncbi:hypothetical protein GCM10029976_024640 [Kribbella albertanoniae]|uniref:Glycosyl hydrolase family 43 n=1 Tax=Kribbella albertanoniae TaxID=1266829 RepID=A0A4R4NZF9_9ACTN|nr:family 43 glycosylhydrolase [Kribbella albertanoniae]TDC14544.1 hypothetical protein E1261_42445 [Kribbella albertanoniae]